MFNVDGKESAEPITAPTKNAGILQSICKSGRQLINFRFANGQ
jgi:hypothetical protein